MKNDVTPLSYQNITIESIDGAMLDWLDLTVDSHVEYPNGERKKVPVKMASGERWVTAKEKKGIRDARGMLILPVVSLRRMGIDPDASMQSLGIETPTLQIAKRLSTKTNVLQNLNQKRSPRDPISPVVYEVATFPFPERKIINYEVQIQTQYITQMNVILEKIFSSLELQNSFVAPLENTGRVPPRGEQFEDRKPIKGHYVVGFFDSSADDSGNLEEFTDMERIVRYTSRVRVPAVLQLDPEGRRPAVRFERTAFGLTFGSEQVHLIDDPYELELIFGDGRIRER